VTDVIGVREGGDDLAKFCVMTPNHGFPFSRLRTATHGRLVALPHRDWQRLPRQLRRVHLGQSTSQDLPAPENSPMRLPLHAGARFFLYASIAQDAFDSSHQPTTLLMGYRALSTAKSTESNCIASINTTRSIGPQKCFKDSKHFLRLIASISL